MTRRSKEQIVIDQIKKVDDKIALRQAQIEELEAEKASLQGQLDDIKAKKDKAAQAAKKEEIFKLIQKSNLSMDEIKELLSKPSEE
jgi:hypothetical protein